MQHRYVENLPKTVIFLSSCIIATLAYFQTFRHSIVWSANYGLCIHGSRDWKSSPDLSFDDIELIDYMYQFIIPFAIITVPTVDYICCLFDRSDG